MSEINITLSRVGPQGARGTDGLNSQDYADSVNTALINAIADYEFADQTLQNNIDSVNSSLISNVATLVAADGTLQSNIDSDVAVLVANIDSVNGSVIVANAAIATEATNRANGDSDLQAQIDNLDLGLNTAAVTALVDSDYVQARETVTSIGLATNTLSYTDEAGNTTNLDLSLYLDDTNLAYIVSGSIDSAGLATFTRDDASSFTVDFSVLFDDTNLARVTSAGFGTGDGVLTLTRDDATTITVDLDGRFALTSAVPTSTDELTEGSTNLYYDSDAVVTSFNTQLAAKTTDNLTEGSTNLYYDSDAVDAAIDVRVNSAFVGNLPVEINTQVGTSYTVVASDVGKLISMGNASANTLTIPANASLALPIGSQIFVLQSGTGQTTVAVTSDTLSIATSFTAKLAERYSVAALTKVGSTQWVLNGDLELS